MHKKQTELCKRARSKHRLQKEQHVNTVHEANNCKRIRRSKHTHGEAREPCAVDGRQRCGQVDHCAHVLPMRLGRNCHDCSEARKREPNRYAEEGRDRAENSCLSINVPAFGCTWSWMMQHGCKSSHESKVTSKVNARRVANNDCSHSVKAREKKKGKVHKNLRCWRAHR